MLVDLTNSVNSFIFLSEVNLTHVPYPQITPTSYDMANGRAYHDDTYSGSGAPNTNGSSLSGGLGQLTDGVTEAESYYTDMGNGHAYEWVGWMTDPSITFDFGAPQQLCSIDLTSNVNNSVGIYLFLSARLTFSNDNVNFSDV